MAENSGIGSRKNCFLPKNSTNFLLTHFFLCCLAPNLQATDTGEPPLQKQHRISTLNKMSDMLLYLDTYTAAFVEFASAQKQPALEIGAAYGFVAIEALKRGTKITANDIDPRHLEILKQNTPEAHRHRLTLAPGAFPYSTDFEPESFSAILASRVFHFIDDNQIEAGAQKMFKWLQKGGKVFITVESPYLKAWQKFIPIFEARKKAGVESPGLLTDPAKIAPDRAGNLPEIINFMTPEALAGAFEAAGFKIERAEYFARPEFPDALRLDGREGIGLIAIKP